MNLSLRGNHARAMGDMMQAGSKMLLRLALTVFAAAVLAGCSRDFNTTNTARFYDAGMRSELARDYLQAEDYYARALVWAGTERVPPTFLSLTLYNLGRMKGHGCKFEEARELLVTSLALEESTSGPASPQISQRLLELARLHFDRNLYADSLPFYAQGIAMIRHLRLEEDDPFAFTEALLDHATALRRTGEHAAADALRAEIVLRQGRETGARPRYPIARYSPNCRGSMLVHSGRA